MTYCNLRWLASTRKTSSHTCQHIVWTHNVLDVRELKQGSRDGSPKSRVAQVDADYPARIALQPLPRCIVSKTWLARPARQGTLNGCDSASSHTLCQCQNHLGDAERMARYGLDYIGENSESHAIHIKNGPINTKRRKKVRKELQNSACKL